MKKGIAIIKNCSECVHCKYNDHWGFTKNQFQLFRGDGWDCEHPDSDVMRILHDHGKDSIKDVEIPEGCPLEDID